MTKKKPMTIEDMARMGAAARAKSLTKKERSFIASEAARARWAGTTAQERSEFARRNAAKRAKRSRRSKG